MGILGTSAASLIPQAGSQGRRKPEVTDGIGTPRPQPQKFMKLVFLI